VLKRNEHFLFVRRVDDGGERHPIEQLHVVFLVRLERCSLVLLHLKHTPTLLIQDEKVKNALEITRVVLEDEAARKTTFDLLDESRLEVAFLQAYSTPSIIAHDCDTM
jgi:hypothetical protein